MTYLEKMRKIYGAEEWTFPVPPELSGLTNRPDLGVEYRKEYPEVKFSESALCDGNILIQDCTPRFPEKLNVSANEKISLLLNCPESRVTFQIIDALAATKTLAELVGQVNTSQTLVLYPGNGALSVLNYLINFEEAFSEGIKVPVTRCFLGKGKYKILVDLPQNLPRNFEEILVIDDVVASGQTVRELACALSRRYGMLPKMRLACWLILSTAEFRPYYDEVFTSWIIKGNYTSRPPINSLSCLLESQEKYDQVKVNYVSKYLKDPDILKQLQRIINISKEE